MMTTSQDQRTDNVRAFLRSDMTKRAQFASTGQAVSPDRLRDARGAGFNRLIKELSGLHHTVDSDERDLINMALEGVENIIGPYASEVHKGGHQAMSRAANRSKWAPKSGLGWYVSPHDGRVESIYHVPDDAVRSHELIHLFQSGNTASPRNYTFGMPWLDKEFQAGYAAHKKYPLGLGKLDDMTPFRSTKAKTSVIRGLHGGFQERWNHKLKNPVADKVTNIMAKGLRKARPVVNKLGDWEWKTRKALRRAPKAGKKALAELGRKTQQAGRRVGGRYYDDAVEMGGRYADDVMRWGRKVAPYLDDAASVGWKGAKLGGKVIGTGLKLVDPVMAAYGGYQGYTNPQSTAKETEGDNLSNHINNAAWNAAFRPDTVGRHVGANASMAKDVWNNSSNAQEAAGHVGKGWYDAHKNMDGPAGKASAHVGGHVGRYGGGAVDTVRSMAKNPTAAPQVAAKGWYDYWKGNPWGDSTSGWIAENVGAPAGKYGWKAQNQVRQGAQAVGNAVKNVKDTAYGTAGKVRETAGDAADAARDEANVWGGAVGDIASRAGRGGERVKNWVGSWF